MSLLRVRKYVCVILMSYAGEGYGEDRGIAEKIQCVHFFCAFSNNLI